MYPVGRDNPPNVSLNQIPLFRRSVWLVRVRINSWRVDPLRRHISLNTHHGPQTGAGAWKHRRENLLTGRRFFLYRRRAVILAPELWLSVRGAVAGASGFADYRQRVGSFIDLFITYMAIPGARGVRGPEVITICPMTLVDDDRLGPFKSGFSAGEAQSVATRFRGYGWRRQAHASIEL